MEFLNYPMDTRIESKENGVPLAEAKSALDRVLASRVFTNSTRLCQFLRYTVEQKLAGNQEVLKEYTIGTNAYGRKSDFDPSHDTIVRTEARRLRRKLKEYYEGEGQNDSVVIFFRSGSYVPVIHWRNAVEGAPSAAAQPKGLLAADLWKQGDGVWVAVAPFLAHGTDSIAASFAFGLGEEILHRLADVRGIRVVLEQPNHASRSSRSEGLSEQTHPEVHVVIGGAVRCDQGRLRATVRVATASGLLLWSQRFDALSEHSALMNLQENIAATLLSRIAPRETLIQRFARTPTEDLYKLYSEVLAAESLLEESSHSSLMKALRKFEDLKTKAPEYARLDCGIVQCCVGLAQRGGFPPDELTARASAVAMELLAKSPDLPEAHSVLGMAMAQEWKWEAAEKSFRTALSLGSQHSSHRQFAIFLLALGRFDESWEHLQIARDMDPLSARQKVSIGRFFYYSRWHAEAAHYYQEAAVFGDLPIEPAYYQALTLIELGRFDEALAIAERLQRHAGSTLPYLAGVAGLYALCGQKETAVELVERRDLLATSSAYSSFRKARLAMALDQTSVAIEFLQASFDCKEPELPFLANDPHFARIRDHKIFLELIKAIFAQ